jgi:hypothetical protein
MKRRHCWKVAASSVIMLIRGNWIKNFRLLPLFWVLLFICLHMCNKKDSSNFHYSKKAEEKLWKTACLAKNKIDQTDETIQLLNVQ